MYEEVTLQQSGQWVQISYYFFSVMLLALFLILKYKSGLVTGFNKVILFIAILPFIIFQYSVFRYGMAWIYELVHVIPDDGALLRTSALFFTIGYLFALPIKNSRIGRK